MNRERSRNIRVYLAARPVGGRTKPLARRDRRRVPALKTPWRPPLLGGQAQGTRQLFKLYLELALETICTYNEENVARGRQMPLAPPP